MNMDIAWLEDPRIDFRSRSDISAIILCLGTDKLHCRIDIVTLCNRHLRMVSTLNLKFCKEDTSKDTPEFPHTSCSQRFGRTSGSWIQPTPKSTPKRCDLTPDLVPHPTFSIVPQRTEAPHSAQTLGWGAKQAKWRRKNLELDSAQLTRWFKPTEKLRVDSSRRQRYSKSSKRMLISAQRSLLVHLRRFYRGRMGQGKERKDISGLWYLISEKVLIQNLHPPKF